METYQTKHLTELCEINHTSPWSVSTWFACFRPEFYPPSYEDSIDPEKLVSPLWVASTLKQQVFINIPPPPYSESSAEFVSETNEQEQPPPYTLSVEQQQAADQDPNPREG